jgi:hypothetical protein
MNGILTELRSDNMGMLSAFILQLHVIAAFSTLYRSETLSALAPCGKEAR